MEKVKCPICMYDFSESYTPLILPCGHTLCEQCVEKIKKECSNDGESYNSKSYCSYFQRKFENTNFEEFDYDISLISDDEKTFNENKKNEKDKENKDNKEDNLSNSEDYEEVEEGEEEEDEDEDDSDSEDEDEKSSLYSNDDSETSANYMNVIQNEEKEKLKKNKDKSFNFKCPYCSKRIKLKDNNFFVNSIILEYNKKLSSKGDNKKKFFCQKCRQLILNNEEHYKKNHEENQIELSEKNFNISKTYLDENQLNEIKEKLSIFLKDFVSDCFSKNNNILDNIKETLFNRLISFSTVSRLRNKAKNKIDYLINKINTIKDYNEKNYLGSLLSELFSNYLMLFQCFRTKVTDIITNKLYILNLAKNKFMHFLIQYFSQGYFHTLLSKTYYLDSHFIQLKNKYGIHKLYNSNLKTFSKFPKDFTFTSKCFECERNGEIVYCLGDKIKSKKFYKFNFIINEKKDLMDIPYLYYDMDTIIHKDNIFIIGGETDKSNPTNLCCKYTISKNLWEKLPQLKHKKSHKAITIIQDKIITFGGESDEETSYIFEILKINRKKNDKWEELRIEGYHANLFNFGFYVYNQNNIILIGGEEHINDDYEDNGYIINLKKKKLIDTFKIRDLFVNNYGSPKFFRGIIYAKDCNLLDVDRFNLWTQLGNITLTIN